MAQAIYYDSSVILAMLFAQDSASHALEIWNKTEYRFSSLLIHFECITVMHRVHSALPAQVRRQAEKVHTNWIKSTIDELTLHALGTEVSRELLSDSRYGALRTLDATHLATAQLFRSAGIELSIATFDKRMREGAALFGFALE